MDATNMSKDTEGKSEKIMDMESKVLWYPDSKRNTHMDKFRIQVNKDYGLNLANYNDLYQWSVDSYPDFWAEVWRFCGVVSSKPYEEVVDVSKRISDVPQWFKGARLNYAENLLKHADQDKVALYAATEANDEIVKVTFGELRRDVSLFAAAMRKMGIQTGDRVVGYLPNGIHAVEAMLAAASIGAIWSSTSVDFGVNGVLDRFSQIQPKLIFSVAAVVYNGKTHDHMEKLTSVVKGLPDLQKIVVIPYARSKHETDLSKIPNSVFMDDFLASGRGEADQFPQLEFEQLPFSHPLFIMYSSGTTGAPKCMVHSAGGTLIQHLKEHILHGNMTSSDVIIYYTTTGWMMWNWLVSALAVGASVVLYDGSPLMPTPSVLWNLTDQLGITIFGTGAKWLSVLQERNLKPAETHNLQSLHTILSTGSPLKPLSYDYVYRCIKSNVLLGSISGGTDIVSCFMGQNPTVPVYRGEIQTRNLGIAVEAWGLDGKPVWGESGELVCLKPIPCQPTHFWNDENGIKYHKAYFSTYPGVWAHGDYCKINPKTGGIVMLGRSDGTLNPNGVRFGSSEIYNIVEAFEEVTDSLCVPQYNADGEERVILFLKMAPGRPFCPELVSKIKGAIRKALSARHVPALLLQTRDIPYTISGKKVEVAVKQVIAGREVAQRGAFSNPDSLDLYKNIPELQNY
ncbi:acetoacetyl-CoA synthetase [Sander lucioperca]|uniref:Acetoacetyl-CoA synthetase n=1 Tax=Sander lucioperca TaxID=283035 RepID=A0A8C9YMA2_SANLU|nr:acetoacetyl-CoA synthetase [Sander lucioperca]XP_035846854.1 acetoacetyl-CoA synthetase [Sander lucioperca]